MEAPGSRSTAISYLLSLGYAPRVSIGNPAWCEVYGGEQGSLRRGPGAALAQSPIAARDEYRDATNTSSRVLRISPVASPQRIPMRIRTLLLGILDRICPPTDCW